MPPTLSAAGRLVRQHDHDRFLTTLFAPADRREDLLALYAFNHEVAKTREAVSEPLLGRIRLQWWRDGVSAIYAGDRPRHHEVIEPLAAAIQRHDLDRTQFERLIDARELDLAEEPPASLAALESYAEGSSAALLRLALAILGVRDEAALAAANAAGIGFALAGLLRAIPSHARARRAYLPADLAAAAGLHYERDLFALKSAPALRAAVAAVAEAASGHLRAAAERRGRVSRAAVPPLLLATLARADLARLRRAGYDPFAPQLAAADPRRSWRLTLAAFTGRF
ncbi:MAG TPA: squalene/phytoene synthase family protein [Stellaceae bacterium]|nr:squalene/phytoene synthase family protein [Stellaceae bacterium]